MKIRALVGAVALSTLVLSGAAFAQDAAPSGPGTMAPIPNPPDAPKASHHHGKHMKKHAKKHHMAKHHMAKKAATADAAAPAK
jgi:hypothetical protein